MHFSKLKFKTRHSSAALNLLARRAKHFREITLATLYECKPRIHGHSLKLYATGFFFITVWSVRRSWHLHTFANKHQFQLQSYAKLVHSRRSFLWNHQYTERKRRIVAWLKAESCLVFRLKTNLLTHVWWTRVVLLPTDANKLSEQLKKICSILQWKLCASHSIFWP